MKKLSIIVPVYNAEKYIEKCASCILEQSYQNIELILVNDGSKDNSLELCKSIAEKDDRVKVFSKENGGAASARNLGIKNATGDYIGFCDADDFHDKDSFETMIRIMEEQNLPTIECLSKVYTPEMSLVCKDDDSRSLKIQTAEEAIREIFLRKGNVSLATRVTRTEYIKELEIPEGKRVEDFYFTICLLTRTGGTAIYSYPFYNCITSEGSVTRSTGGSIYMDALYFYEKANEYLQDYDYELDKEKEYYLLKMYYLLAISLTGEERKKYKDLIQSYKRELKQKRDLIKSNKYLLKKEILVLKIAMRSFFLARLLFLIKKGVRK